MAFWTKTVCHRGNLLVLPLFNNWISLVFFANNWIDTEHLSNLKMTSRENFHKIVTSVEILQLLANFETWVVSCQKHPPDVFYEKAVPKNFAILTGKYLFIGLQLYQKETPTPVFFYEYCEIFKNTYFEVHLRTTASVSLEIC